MTTAAPSAHRNARVVSARQQLALDRADRRAAARTAAGPRLAPQPDLGQLPADVRLTLNEYRSQSLDPQAWATVRELTIRMVAGICPPTPVTARNAMAIVSGFLVWVGQLASRSDPGAPVTATELLGSTLVEQYVDPRRTGIAVTGARPASVATARSLLRRAVATLDADHAPTTIPATPRRPSYTSQECADFVELALVQPTVARTRNACFLLSLCLGAGLTPVDLRHVRPGDIRTVTDPDLGQYLCVDVPAGTMRTVVVARAYQHLLTHALTLAEGLDPARPALGRGTARRNVTQAARHRIVSARTGQGVDIDVHRLRSTWLVALLQAPVPLPALLAQAGLRSARSLTDLCDHCPTTDVRQVAAAMLAMADPRDGGVR